MRAVAALACPLLLACAPGSPAATNVLLLVMDTTRADRCSFLGYARETTPRLAEIAREGWSFASAWSPAPWTLPAHAALFTGVSSGRHGCGRDEAYELGPEWTTLAEHLHGAGWATGCFSANRFVAAEYGLTQGFECEEAALHDGRPARADVVHERALAWIRSQSAAGHPFFAFVNDMDVHGPLDPPEPFAARFRHGARDDADAGEAALRRLGPGDMTRISLCGEPLPAAQRQRMSDLYDADVASLDDRVGAFVDTLRKEGLLDRTLLVVTSDHGEGLGDHGWMEHMFGVHAEQLRVPLVLRLPGRFDGGRELSEVVQLEDVLPTVLEACGLPAPDGLDGASLTRGLGGRIAFAAQDSWQDRVAIVQASSPGVDVRPLLVDRRSATDGRWHLVLDLPDHARLYDLGTDPCELLDVARAHPDEVARLRALLDASPTR